jgi:hypothetical protein
MTAFCPATRVNNDAEGRHGQATKHLECSARAQGEGLIVWDKRIDICKIMLAIVKCFHRDKKEVF